MKKYLFGGNEMEKGCIYCGCSSNLSKSDIVPDALTNAKIINPFVCHIEHNSKFSDMFENEVISKLALITNELDIKSSKGKTYAAYEANFLIGDTEYKTKVISESNLFMNDKKMVSLDEKSLLGPIENMRKIKGSEDADIIEVDVNQIEIEKRVIIDLSVYFSIEMFRLAAKIAFEWYCLKNKVITKRIEFLPVIDFITTGKGVNIVSFINNKEVYDVFKQMVNHGSHVLLSYIAIDNSVNVIVNLFGIAMYNVRLSDKIIDGCNSNALFQELTLDAKHIDFTDTNIEELQLNIMHCFESKSIGMGMQIMIPKDKTDITSIYKLNYISYYEVFQKKLELLIEPTKETSSLLLNNIQDILQESAVTIRGLKRFVKEHQKNFDSGLKLNPNGTNKKSTFMFYILLHIGKSNGAIKNLFDLNEELKKIFLDSTIDINDELAKKLNDEIFSAEENMELIMKGAKDISAWKYE